MTTPAVRPFISRCAWSRAEIFVWTDSTAFMPTSVPAAAKTLL
jgi:hypothetical protein